MNKLLNTLEENIKTDIQFKEIDGFIGLSKRVDSQNISTAVIDAWKEDSLLRVSHVFVGDTRMFTLVPRVGNYSETHELAENIFDLSAIQRRRTEIEAERADIALINTSGNSNLLYRVLGFLKEDLGFGKITILSANVPEVEATQVFSFSEGEKDFSLNELIRRVPASLGETDSDTLRNIETDGYDFLLLIGKDILEVYSYAEISQEEFEENQIEIELIN